MTAGPGAPDEGRRHVPWLLRSAVWCRGFHTQVGWVLVGLGAALLWWTTPWSDLHDFRGPLQAAQGRLTERLPTHIRQPGAALFVYRYTFVTDDGRPGAAWCYGDSDSVRAGDRVTVEFPAGRPEVSRIRGMRRGLLEEQHWTTYVVFAAGLAFVAIGLTRALKTVGLLVSGRAAEGVLKSRDRTGEAIGRAAEIVHPRVPILYTLTVEFPADDGQTREAVCRTYRPQDLVPPVRPQVLYRPRRPASALVVQGLPGAPQIGEDGRLALTSPLRALARLAIPALATGALVAYACWRYLA